MKLQLIVVGTLVLMAGICSKIVVISSVVEPTNLKGLLKLCQLARKWTLIWLKLNPRLKMISSFYAR